MFAVITKSRRFAMNKLMANYGLRPPMNDITFITTTAELAELRREKAANNEPIHALLIWERGRSTQDAKRLFTIAQELIGTGVIQKPTINGAKP